MQRKVGGCLSGISSFQIRVRRISRCAMDATPELCGKNDSVNPVFSFSSGVRYSLCPARDMFRAPLKIPASGKFGQKRGMQFHLLGWTEGSMGSSGEIDGN